MTKKKEFDDIKKGDTQKEPTVDPAPGVPEMESDNELPQTISLSKEEFEKVKERLDQLQTERDNTIAVAQRVQADFDNFRRRNACIYADSVEEGARSVIKELLPVLDNLDRALQSADGIDENWLGGIRMVERQFVESLHKCGLSEIPTDGVFDPELHNAVMQEEAEGKDSGTILEVLQKGYSVKNRIIRHSMVKVAK